MNNTEEFTDANAMMNSERKSVKLDLYIDDDEVLHASSNSTDDNVDEVLCLRILSCKTKYRFGGLKVHVVSPVFSIGKIFNVEFDEDSEVALIKSQKDDDFLTNSEPNIAASTSKAATIVISPDREDLELHKSPTVSADLTLFEASDCKIEFDEKLGASSGCGVGSSGGKPLGGGEENASGRRMSQHLKRFMTKRFQSTWHSAVRVKRFFSDSLTFWN